jgi:hypothetical protein
MQTSEGYAARCHDCRDTGVVMVYAHANVRAVKNGKPLRCANRAAVVCHCGAADHRYGNVERDGRPLGRYEPQGYCVLPSHHYTPTPETVAADSEAIQRWLDERGTARVGTFTVDDWQGFDRG